MRMTYIPFFVLSALLHLLIFSRTHKDISEKIGLVSVENFQLKQEKSMSSIKIIYEEKKGLMDESKKQTKQNQLGSQNSVRSAQMIGKKVDDYFVELQKYISSKQSYPFLGKKLKQEGKVLVELSIEKSGEFKEVKLIESSGSEILDESVIENLKKLRYFKPFPLAIEERVLKPQVPVEFKLK